MKYFILVSFLLSSATTFAQAPDTAQIRDLKTKFSRLNKKSIRSQTRDQYIQVLSTFFDLYTKEIALVAKKKEVADQLKLGSTLGTPLAAFWLAETLLFSKMSPAAVLADTIDDLMRTAIQNGSFSPQWTISREPTRALWQLSLDTEAYRVFYQSLNVNLGEKHYRLLAPMEYHYDPALKSGVLNYSPPMLFPELGERNANVYLFEASSSARVKNLEALTNSVSQLDFYQTFDKAIVDEIEREGFRFMNVFKVKDLKQLTEQIISEAKISRATLMSALDDVLTFQIASKGQLPSLLTEFGANAAKMFFGKPSSMFEAARHRLWLKSGSIGLLVVGGIVLYAYSLSKSENLPYFAFLTSVNRACYASLNTFEDGCIARHLNTEQVTDEIVLKLFNTADSFLNSSYSK